MSDPQSAGRPPTVGDASFDEFYYAHNLGDPYERSEAVLRFFAHGAGRIVADIAPKTLLDAGCATGLLVGALRERGVDATGVDLSSYAISRADDAVRSYVRHGSITEEFSGRYDLITCIEVVEHMPPREAEAAIANFCRHTDDVLFSSTPSDFKEPTHINVHPPEYWAAEFARHGFYRDLDIDVSYVTAWAVRFRRSTEPWHRIVRGYERRYWDMTLERNGTRARSLELQHEVAVRQHEVEATRVSLIAAETSLAQAHDRIQHMERSVFWRARSAVQRLLGR